MTEGRIWQPPQFGGPITVMVEVLSAMTGKQYESQFPHNNEKNYSECPACHHWQQDEDGFGVLYCETCGYCTHASVNGTTCGLCKREVVRA